MMCTCTLVFEQAVTRCNMALLEIFKFRVQQIIDPKQVSIEILVSQLLLQT